MITITICRSRGRGLRRIGPGEWASGEALPSIASLAEHYNTSRATVAKALRRLADDGSADIVAHWGTFRT